MLFGEKRWIILEFVIEEKLLKEMVSITEELRYFGSWQI